MQPDFHYRFVKTNIRIRLNPQPIQLGFKLTNPSMQVTRLLFTFPPFFLELLNCVWLPVLNSKLEVISHCKEWGHASTSSSSCSLSANWISFRDIKVSFARMSALFSFSCWSLRVKAVFLSSSCLFFNLSNRSRLFFSWRFDHKVWGTNCTFYTKLTQQHIVIEERKLTIWHWFPDILLKPEDDEDNDLLRLVMDGSIWVDLSLS